MMPCTGYSVDQVIIYQRFKSVDQVFKTLVQLVVKVSTVAKLQDSEETSIPYCIFEFKAII